jgi:hypothetical protein
MSSRLQQVPCCLGWVVAVTSKGTAAGWAHGEAGGRAGGRRRRGGRRGAGGLSTLATWGPVQGRHNSLEQLAMQDIMLPHSNVPSSHRMCVIRSMAAAEQ